MDDFVASVETEPQIITLCTQTMLLIKIPMHKWATNSLMLQNLLRTQGEECKTIVKILEIEWNTELDFFGNSFSTSLCAVQGKPIAKRWLLRCIASFYDPLGPFTILEKILFQDTWVLDITWDELLPRKVTLPRLEILAALMGARLSRYFCAETNIHPSSVE
ncbi:integrase catalytic domain-containing protein [Trichonephila clavipes]|uniref:Integrase catalytic domain-containing protein n=1 Tax=Trichonephila clavipes TaxID=2585209 RepID=A0A8X6WC97_TRICX|nr:integrase catalytic domain-containing protein [Trichonephila clavipes]